MGRRVLVAAAVALTVTLCTACGGGGGGGGGDEGGDHGSSAPPVKGFVLTSPAFRNGAAIPRRFGCDGAGVSPPLAWAGVPAATRELAVVVVDLDANQFVHWVLTRLPVSTSGLTEGRIPSGAVEADNSGGRPGWYPPCPPSGTHHYRFTVVALDHDPGIRAGEAGPAARRAVEGAGTASASLAGTYHR